MRRLLRCLGGLLCCLLPLLAWAAADDARLVEIPPLTARVTDLTNTLAAPDKEALENKLAYVEERKGAQIAVLLLPTTGAETIEQFGIRLFDAWKVGRKGVDDGVLLIVAKDDRKLRIEVGYGLEGALGDAVAKRIIDEIMTPLFKSGDFRGGLQLGVEAIVKVVDGESLPPPGAAVPGAAGGGYLAGVTLPGFVLALLLFAGVIGGATLRLLLGNLLGCAIAGVVGGGLLWLFEGGWESFLVGAGSAIFLSLLISEGGGSRRGSSDILGNILSGILGAILGGMGGGRGGGGGGGGFGGGGGRGGGGGASGGW